ncbi:hypothetical protein [Bryocella elongata]|uniref:hypothetical protein n=1 Tax=Bryocella elongata TaxID=863522 RepID=UPI003899569B
MVETPNHDRIGREGIFFRNAICTNALCAPALQRADRHVLQVNGSARQQGP